MKKSVLALAFLLAIFTIPAPSFGYLPEDMMLGIGMILELFVKPDSVSFTGLKLQEVAAPGNASSPEWGTHTGYFSDEVYASRWYHYASNGAGVWNEVQGNNLIGNDMSRMWRWPKPWSTGFMSYTIPIAWKSKYSEGRAEDGRFVRTYYSKWEMTEDAIIKTKHGQELTLCDNGDVFLNGEQM